MKTVTWIENQCGILFDANGRRMMYATSTLYCQLERGHQGPHRCRYLGTIEIANTGETFCEDELRAQKSGLGWLPCTTSCEREPLLSVAVR